jgi:hypothetical protein
MFCAKALNENKPLIFINNIKGLFIVIFGAGGRNRTDMTLRSLDFESSASTSFTTPANEDDLYRNSSQSVKKKGA